MFRIASIIGRVVRQSPAASIAATALVVGAFAASDAHALSGSNGLNINGLTTNGLGMNGIAFNGLNLNGLTTNGLGMNGLGFNGMNVNGARPQPSEMLRQLRRMGEKPVVSDERSR